MRPRRELRRVEYRQGVAAAHRDIGAIGGRRQRHAHRIAACRSKADHGLRRIGAGALDIDSNHGTLVVHAAAIAFRLAGTRPVRPRHDLNRRKQDAARRQRESDRGHRYRDTPDDRLVGETGSAGLVEVDDPDRAGTLITDEQQPIVRRHRHLDGTLTAIVDMAQPRAPGIRLQRGGIEERCAVTFGHDQQRTIMGKRQSECRVRHRAFGDFGHAIAAAPVNGNCTAAPVFE